MRTCLRVCVCVQVCVCVACIVINQLNCPIICNRTMLKCIFKISCCNDYNKLAHTMKRNMYSIHVQRMHGIEVRADHQSVQERNKLSTSKRIEFLFLSVDFFCCCYASWKWIEARVRTIHTFNDFQFSMLLTPCAIHLRS